MTAVPYHGVMISTANFDWITPHPKGTQARVLLSSVFGPYAQDDEFGSRAINPMELYHNQVTREQGSFSLRMFHRSWGLMMIQRNISAPSTLLDFPTLDRFQARTDLDRLRHRRHLWHHPQLRQSSRNVPPGAPAFAQVQHRRRRTRRRDSRASTS